MLLYVAGLAIAAVAGKLIYERFFKRGGTEVQYQVYHKINDKIYLESPKVYTGNNYRVESGIEKFGLAKEHKLVEIEGIDPSFYIGNTRGTPFVKLLRVGQDEYKVMEERYTPTNHIEYDSIDRDVAFWAYNAKRENELNHKVDDKWDWLKKSAVLIVTIMACIILFYMTFNKIDDMMDEAYGERQADITETLNTVKSYLQIVEKDVMNSDSIGKTETTAPKPVGQQGATT